MRDDRESQLVSDRPLVSAIRCGGTKVDSFFITG
jgi:hypothetical protein